MTHVTCCCFCDGQSDSGSPDLNDFEGFPELFGGRSLGLSISESLLMVELLPAVCPVISRLPSCGRKIVGIGRLSKDDSGLSFFVPKLSPSQSPSSSNETAQADERVVRPSVRPCTHRTKMGISCCNVEKQIPILSAIWKLC